MSKRKLAIAAGALVVIGGAAAIAAVGHRETRMGHRDMIHEMGGPNMGQGHMGQDHMAQGYGRGEGRRGGRSMRGEGDDAMGGGRGEGRGMRGRSMSADDYDARSRERFARLDKNSDGVIDAAEVEVGMTAMSERGGRFGEMMRQRFQGRFDANRDGRTTRQEMLDRVKRDFDRLDLDGDGRITDADLPPMMRGRGVLKGEAGRIGMGGPGGAMGGRLGRLIAADTNKDGIITLEEAQAEAGRRFDQADRNKDGAIDKADHDAIAKEMTDYRVRRFFHAHGAGRDGKLTREQFYKSAKERFVEMDINNDGRVDRLDWMPGRGMGPGRGPGDRPEEGTGPGPGQGQGPGMRDRGPPR